MTDEQHPPPEPPVIPGFRTGPFLGAGGSGEVWTVVRDDDGTRLAAKVLRERPEDVGLELALLQRIEHDHVLRLQDTVLVAGEPPRVALITALADGGSLAEAIEGRGHLTVGELVTVLCPVARAMHDLHALGMVHGDLSPSNVLLTDDGRPLVADLGVARLAGVPQAQVWGTDGFVAPEVLGGALPEPAADVFALGALAWTALVGTPPPPAALRPHLPDVAPQAPAVLCDLVLSCLAHTAEARPTAGDLAVRLWQAAPPEPAPVAGSTGRRVAQRTDPGAGLTQRIRERAEPVEAAAPTPWWRQRVVRRTAVAGGLVGAVCAGLAVTGSGGADADAGGRPAAAASPSSPARTDARPARSAPTAPSALVSGRPSASTTPAQPSSPVQLSSPARSAAPARPAPSTRTPDPQQSRTGSSPSGPAATPPRPAAAATPRPEQLGERPRDVVQGLADRRAAAWVSGKEADLSKAFVVGSPGWTSDRADLRRAASQRVAYRGLRFTVRSATLDFTGPAVLADVVVDRSAFTTVGPGAGRPVPASPGERALLTLDWTPAGWRIVGWSAPPAG